jgi:hypothetical protein
MPPPSRRTRTAVIECGTSAVALDWRERRHHHDRNDVEDRAEHEPCQRVAPPAAGEPCDEQPEPNEVRKEQDLNEHGPTILRSKLDQKSSKAREQGCC